MNKPNADSANNDSLPGQLDAYLSGWVWENLDGQLPAEVVSYDPDTNRATLRPLVMVLTTGGQKITRADVPNIPVFRYGAGGFFQRYPVKKGDFGWIKSCDLDVSLVLQRGGKKDIPNTKRQYSFSDAMFYPDTIKDWVVSGADLDAMTLQSLDGNSVVSIAQDSIELRVGSQVLRLDASGLTHNGTNIGDTHTHTGSPTAPDGPVSPTGAPQ